jgi:hypothetical protein
VHSTVFGDGFPTMSISQISGKFPWRKLLRIGRSVVGEPIYNLLKTDCVFIERFMRYVSFYSDGFFLWFMHT